MGIIIRDTIISRRIRGSNSIQEFGARFIQVNVNSPQGISDADSDVPLRGQVFNYQPCGGIEVAPRNWSYEDLPFC